MKKIALILSFACIILTSCKDNSIKYNGPDVINIVLKEYYNIDAESNDPLSYSSDNKRNVTVSDDGVIYGKNVGEANVTISNSENELNIPVIVNLFEEPTVNFGATTSEIKSLYGEPKRNSGDSVFVYGSGQYWYSPTVWEMDFFFHNNKYYESNLYIQKDLDLLLNKYLEENYFYSQELIDTINGEIINLYIYLDSPNADEAKVIVGKQYNAGPYNDILLVYAPFEAVSSRKTDFISRSRK